jgi:hypothetical protein
MGTHEQASAAFGTASTHQGARPYQEDRFGIWTGPGGAVFSVVIDGAGGHGGGAEAAQAALDEAERHWREAAGNISDGGEFLDGWMLSAHEAVNREAERIARPARAVAVAHSEMTTSDSGRDPRKASPDSSGRSARRVAPPDEQRGVENWKRKVPLWIMAALVGYFGGMLLIGIAKGERDVWLWVILSLVAFLASFFLFGSMRRK